MLPDATRFYIDGAWTAPAGAARRAIINPATEEPVGEVALGDTADVDRAVAAAKRAFPSYARTTVAERLELLRAINAKLIERGEDIAAAISAEMGAPAKLARGPQAGSGVQHFAETMKVLESFRFEEPLGETMVRHEPVGVCALITPWNWPVNQVATKVAPALAAGCTMVLKPSELAPLDAVVLAEIINEVGVPAGVFNLVHGDGPGVGAPLCAHPDIDMISFTGSTRAGVAISEAAAPDVKRVALELGGKSACIVLEDADLEVAVKAGVRDVLLNTGQSCNATARLLVPESRYQEAAEIAVRTAQATKVGSPDGHIGPIANKAQYERVIALIERGVAEGADLLTGGAARPTGLDKGYYVAPTVFGRVTPGMTIAREEIFGPVITIMTYKDENEAVDIANDTEYGLSGAVWSGERAHAVSVAAQLRTGMVHVNGAGLDSAAPFGGFKKSGKGREWGKYGLEEFLELKSVYGAYA